MQGGDDDCISGQSNVEMEQRGVEFENVLRQQTHGRVTETNRWVGGWVGVTIRWSTAYLRERNAVVASTNRGTVLPSGAWLPILQRVPR